MSSEKPPGPKSEGGEDDPAKGPNLALIYCLLGAALIIAFGIALLIVLPFYRRH